MATIQGKIAMVLCATASGVGVAGAAMAVSRTHDAGASDGRSVAAAMTAPATTVVAIPGLATFNGATLPEPLRLTAVVVHPRKVVVRNTVKRNAVAAPNRPGPGKKNWATPTWSSGGKAGGGGTESGGAPPPPPPPPSSNNTAKPPPPPPPPTPGGSPGSGGTAAAPPPQDGSAGGGSTSGPTSTGRPSVRGGNTAGSTLTASTGTWTGSPTFTISWFRCNRGGCSAIGSGASYTTTRGDIGSSFYVQVTATSSAGSRTARSDNSDTIEAGG